MIIVTMMDHIRACALQHGVLKLKSHHFALEGLEVVGRKLKNGWQLAERILRVALASEPGL